MQRVISKFDGAPVRLGYSIDGEASEVTLLLQKDGATVAQLARDRSATGKSLYDLGRHTAQGPLPRTAIHRSWLSLGCC